MQKWTALTACSFGTLLARLRHHSCLVPFSVSAGEPIQVALVLRHLLSQPCPSPLCYPPNLSWSVLLPCLSSSLLVSLLSSGHWPHLKATSGLSSSPDTTLRLPLPENHPFFLPLNFSEEPWAPQTNLTRQEFCPVLLTPLCIALSAARKVPIASVQQCSKVQAGRHS